MMPSYYDFLCRVYCTAHRTAKGILGRGSEPNVSFFHCYDPAAVEEILSAGERWEVAGSPAINDSPHFPAAQRDLLWGENVVDADCFQLPDSPVGRPEARYGSAEDAWRGFVSDSTVPAGWANSGLHAVCFSRSTGQWALSSWVWTSAALARCYASVGDLGNMKRICGALLSLQLPDGGWVVRHDFCGGRTTPMIAPNDSAYIANNAFLIAYDASGDSIWLDAAERCASWIMETAQPDGLVYIGQNGFTDEWITNSNIVDVGFTAALFAKLFRITGMERYRAYLKKFVKAYLSAFYDDDGGSFATAIDGDRNKRGGRFSRGQAWALEGLVPASEVIGSEELERVIARTVETLLANQMRDGGWAYNLSHPFMGQDCKGVPVIARALAEWGVTHGNAAARDAASNALNWCRAHTLLSGVGAGGIYSYCLEGCVTHDLYSEAAFVYSSSYALETEMILGK